MSKEVPTVDEVLDSVKALNYFLNSMLYVFARRSQIDDEIGEKSEFISSLFYNEISVAIKSRNKVKIRELYPLINKEAHIIDIFIPNIEAIINMLSSIDRYLKNVETLIYEVRDSEKSRIMNDFYNLVNALGWLDPEHIINAHRLIEERIIL